MKLKARHNMSAAEYEAFREEYPYSERYREMLGKPFASKTELAWAREFFDGIGSKFYTNKNSIYFKEERDVVFFKLGMWLNR
jgi:hypothetical protein